ncbi:capsid assembly protein [Magnetovibrio sp.]|uniref:capsid assembly protein n=1 Tax=Magnetovibrio sp. TaxID=2024836 RepID=UPI002F934CE3
MNTPNSDQNGCPPWLPAKFWDADTGAVRTEALARSYQELERHLGNSQTAAMADMPEHPGAYDIMIDDDLLSVDDEVNQRLFENGFSQAQAQLVYDLASERMMPMVAQITANYENKREEDRLLQHFGGVERFQAIRPQLSAWGKANLTPTVYENLVASAEGVIAMFEMMKNREPALTRAAEPRFANSEQDIKRMMKDPRYWKDRDPTFVAQVREGFRNLYPDA